MIDSSKKNKDNKYIEGIRIYQNKDAQRTRYSGVITPNKLMDFLKSGKADGAKTEYQGDVQFKFTIFLNDDGSASVLYNDWKPNQVETNELDWD